MVMPISVAVWLVLLCLPVSAEAVSAWQLTGSANVGFSTYRDSPKADSQTEFSAFVDGQYLDGLGGGAGYIRQDRNASSRNRLTNNIIYLGAWKAFYTDVIPGRISVLLDSYTVNGNVEQGKGKGAAAATQADTDDIDIINPTLIYMNADKDLSLELSYARSRLASVNAAVADVTVRQWTPAVALFINDRYDRIYLRHYAIDLSNDSRATNITHTTGTELKWTHWARAGGTGLRDVTVALFAGERLYGVDREARRVDCFPEKLTGAASIGTIWGLSQASAFYAYAGLERYANADDGSRFTAGYLYLGARRQW